MTKKTYKRKCANNYSRKRLNSRKKLNSRKRLRMAGSWWRRQTKRKPTPTSPPRRWWRRRSKRTPTPTSTPAMATASAVAVAAAAADAAKNSVFEAEYMAPLRWEDPVFYKLLYTKYDKGIFSKEDVLNLIEGHYKGVPGHGARGEYA